MFHGLWKTDCDASSLGLVALVQLNKKHDARSHQGATQSGGKIFKRKNQMIVSREGRGGKMEVAADITKQKRLRGIFLSLLRIRDINNAHYSQTSRSTDKIHRQIPDRLFGRQLGGVRNGWVCLSRQLQKEGSPDKIL